MMVEVDRAAVQEKQVDGLAAHGREACVRRGGERGDRRHDVRADDDRGHAPRGAAQANRIVPDVERVAAPPEQRGDRPRQERLLDVEPLEQVECAEQEQEDECRLQRPLATAREVEGGHDQRRAGGKCKRVEDGHGLHRFEVEQQVAAPADVRRQRRADIDDARDRAAAAANPGRLSPRRTSRSSATRLCRNGRHEAVSRREEKRSCQSLITSQAASAAISAAPGSSITFASRSEAARHPTARPSCHSWTRRPNTRTRGPS